MEKEDSVANYMRLYETIISLKNPEECLRFFQDLCTPLELKNMERRFEVAISLTMDEPYSLIIEHTGASSAIISRVRRAMLNNGAGGVMKDILEREGLSTPVLDSKG